LEWSKPAGKVKGLPAIGIALMIQQLRRPNMVKIKKDKKSLTLIR